MSRCVHHRPFMGKNFDENYCTLNGYEKDKMICITRDDCEKCESFESKYIEYPLTINGIKNEEIDITGLRECGTLCEVKPCGEEYEDKSYIGIYIGELPISIYNSFDKKTKILSNKTMPNPAIFVPELRKVIYGCESWWRKIDSIEDFKGISEKDIDNLWYVQMLRQMRKDVKE